MRAIRSSPFLNRAGSWNLKTLEPVPPAPTRFSRVAAVYDWLSWIYTGGQIARLKRKQTGDLTPGSRVLYAGVGTGEELPQALAAGVDLTALDVSAKMLERARRRLGTSATNVRFCDEDLFAHQPSEPYDTVVVNFFLNVFAAGALPRVLAHLGSMLRPGGQLFVGDFAPPVTGRLERWLQKAYYLPPLTLFWLVTRNPWHPLYDYRPLATRSGFDLCAHHTLPIFGIGPRWLSTLVFEKSS